MLGAVGYMDAIKCGEAGGCCYSVQRQQDLWVAAECLVAA